MGSLYLVPSSIDYTQESNVQTTAPYILEVLQKVECLVMETPKVGRGFIKSIDNTFSFQTKTYFQLNKYTSQEDIQEIIRLLLSGKDVALLSDAGNPCIADPGNILVSACHLNDLKVVPMIGPSSILMALIASGFNGQQFSFSGYLEKDEKRLRKQLEDMQFKASRFQYTSLFMDTPFRSFSMFEKCLKVLGSETHLLVACAIGTPYEYIQVKTVRSWMNNFPDIQKKPTIFGIGQLQSEGVKSRRKK